MTSCNNSITPDRLHLIETFASFVALAHVNETIDAAARQLLPQISPDTPLAFTELHLAELDPPPPSSVGTIRVAVFYPGRETGVERHANSTQVLFSLRGTGETRVLRDDTWEVDVYGHVTESGGLEERWHLVEAGVWHHSVATGNEPWILVALHSARQVQDERQ